MVEPVALTEIVDVRGRLVCAQYPDALPFVPQRVFVITDVPNGQSRGGHGHRTCELVLIAVSGSCVVQVWDGPESVVVPLAKGGPGLHLPARTFSRQVDFSADAVLLVLASDAYDESEYITEEEYFGP